MRRGGNEYAENLGTALFEAITKNVLAAIVVSIYSPGGEDMTQAKESILSEWHTLYMNGIVPQKPPDELMRLWVYRSHHV
jgi:hypothetical protein